MSRYKLLVNGRSKAGNYYRVFRFGQQEVFDEERASHFIEQIEEMGYSCLFFDVDLERITLEELEKEKAERRP